MVAGRSRVFSLFRRWGDAADVDVFASFYFLLDLLLLFKRLEESGFESGRVFCFQIFLHVL